MRITCPHCGPRDLAEYYYWGDATRTTPELGSTDEAAAFSHVYERPNPRGLHGSIGSIWADAVPIWWLSAIRQRMRFSA